MAAKSSHVTRFAHVMKQRKRFSCAAAIGCQLFLPFKKGALGISYPIGLPPSHPSVH